MEEWQLFMDLFDCYPIETHLVTHRAKKVLSYVGETSDIFKPLTMQRIR